VFPARCCSVWLVKRAKPEKERFSAIDKKTMVCNNPLELKWAQASNKVSDFERDIVAQSGNIQRMVGWCETIGQAESEVPSGVGGSKPGTGLASKTIRVRPLQQRGIIQPDQETGGGVPGEVVMATLRRNKVVTRKLCQCRLNFSSLFKEFKAGSFFVPIFRDCYPRQV